MASTHLSVYLNDHLSGSEVALELLTHLDSVVSSAELKAFLSVLRAEIAIDRKELESLMAALDISTSSARKAMGWLAEKGTRFKLWMDDQADGRLRLLEALELIAIGIDGKRALWRALDAASERNALLKKSDFRRLERRAQVQRDSIEKERLRAACDAFGGDT